MLKKKSFPLSRVYRLLEPGPVVLVTTGHKGKANIVTMSWHTMMEFRRVDKRSASTKLFMKKDAT